MARLKGTKTNNISDEVELNTRRGDTNLCVHCKEFIDTLYKGGARSRDNRIDCEDEGGITSYHLECYDLEVFGKITETTKKRLRRLNES